MRAVSYAAGDADARSSAPLASHRFTAHRQVGGSLSAADADVRRGNVPSVTSRFTRTPTPIIVITQFVTGAVLLVFALLSAVNGSGEFETLLAVGLGAVGGVLIGQGLGMARHRRAAQQAG